MCLESDSLRASDGESMAYPVARHAASVLREWHEDQREDGGAHVPRDERELEVREAGLVNVPGPRHLLARGAVGASGDAAEDGAVQFWSVATADRTLLFELT